jgi:SPP1 family predicted phage head-tail adaptor
MSLSSTLRHKIEVQARVAGTDDLGQPLDTWETVASPWADIRHMNGMTALKGGADLSVVTASIRIRYRTGLNAGMRVVHGSKIYNIEAVLPDENGRVWMDLTCKVLS